MMDVKSELKARAETVEPVLASYVSDDNPTVAEMLAHPVSAGGKRVRPALVLLACEAVGGDPQKVLSAAASVELLHTFTLVHDDMMDADDQRRGKPTVHKLWGDAMGILVGDTLYAKAFKAVCDARAEGIEAARVLDAITVFNEANSLIHDGQLADMMFEQRQDVSEAEYLDMIEKKTAALLEASARIGGILGGGTPQQVEALGAYGLKVGTAFQIHDDLLDLLAEQAKLGKPVGSDVREAKKSIIIIHALKNAKDADAEVISKALGSPDLGGQELGDVIKALESSGSISYAKARLDDLNAGAKNELTKLPESEARQVLDALADYVIKREY